MDNPQRSQPAPRETGAGKTILSDAHQEGAVAPTHLQGGAAASPPRADTSNLSNRTPWGSTSPTQAGANAIPKPGTRINHYELIRELGKGGMGSVFLARDLRLGRKVAIKFLHTNNPELTRRFVQEARTTAQCSHENIVVIYEVGEFGSSPYMVLEYLQGEPLHRMLFKGERLPVGRAIELMVPVVRALATAHEHGIVHRDLKPENIIMTTTGTIKVLDFGIAKVLNREDRSRDAAAELDIDVGGGAAPGQAAEPSSTDSASGDSTRHGALIGTLAFMSPEQWHAGVNQTIDHRADFWAVGIMLFRMLAGRHPLAPLVGEQLCVVGALDEPMPRLRDVAPDVPPALADAVDRCLMKRKEQRFPDALSLLRALEPFLPGHYRAGADLAADQSPYAGLSSFQESDADRFFGRAGEVAAMVHRIHDRPLLGIAGPSGAGKSSFVRAGVVPALKRSGEKWEAVVVRPGRQPLAALAHVIAPLLANTQSVADDATRHQKVIERLRAEPGYVGAVLRSRALREKQKILLFVDQFEELYTLVSEPAERLAFTQCLTGIADDATAPARVVISIRSDFLDRASEDPAFMAELSQALVFLGAPDRAGLRDALIQPAEMAGYKFETEAMVDNMLDHLAQTSGALPLLQFAASQLWETRDPARKLLTQASYDSIGGIAGALASHADSVVTRLPPSQQALARAIFLRLITSERTRAIVSLEELRELNRDPSEVQRLLDVLVAARLLVVQTGGGSGGTVEIVHESLIDTWPTLKRWLDEGQEDSAFLEQLRNAAKQWQLRGRSADLLWRGEAVEEARRFRRRFHGELGEAQEAFLAAVLHNEVRRARLKRNLTLGGIALAVALFAAAIVALVVIDDARKRANENALVAQYSAEQAQRATAEAEQNLREVQKKEAARAAAAEAAQKANEELQAQQLKLIDALERAENARKMALRMKKQSDRNALDAKEAKDEALGTAREIQKLLVKERERAKRLESQLGSPIVETLE